jgi:protein required for attachment to host cells
MKKVWIVVANSSQAKIYRAENAEKLIEHALLYHDSSQLHGTELYSDAMGRRTSSLNFSYYGSDTSEPKTSYKEKEFSFFASDIAQLLDKARNKGEYEKLYLIAKAPFLGYLRQAFSSQVEKLIVSEINKDLTQLSPEQVREYLPPAL